MSVWRKIGIAGASVDDLDDRARELLLGSRGSEAGAPLLLEPGSLEDLVAYLLELESPDRGGPGYAKLRRALLASAMELETRGGERVVALAGPADRFVRERTSEFVREDRRDLLALSSELGLAAQTLLCLVNSRFRKRAHLSFGFRHERFSGFGAGTPLSS